jgi:hypothetical protein
VYNGSSIRDERAAVITYRTDLAGVDWEALKQV